MKYKIFSSSLVVVHSFNFTISKKGRSQDFTNKTLIEHIDCSNLYIPVRVCYNFLCEKCQVIEGYTAYMAFYKCCNCNVNMF